MKIWLVRHGQTNLNLAKLMQGRTDEPLNETGIRQAKEAALQAQGVSFDAVYSSPLSRAVVTAALISGRPQDEIIRDERLIETDFGIYEKKPYLGMGLRMTLYWALPELFPAPPSVETIRSMTERSASFLKELEQQPFENVLVSCHGGIIRALSGYLEDRKSGILWRPRPRNCEFRVYLCENGTHRRISG